MTRVTSNYAMPEIELPGHGRPSSGNGTFVGYKLELRSSYTHPTVIGKFVIDNVWREFSILQGAAPFGVNIPIKEWDADMLKHGIVSRTVVEAHIAALFALLEATQPSGSLCIQARIVMVDYKWSYEIIERGVSDTIHAERYFEKSHFHPRQPFSNELAQPVDEKESVS